MTTRIGLKERYRLDEDKEGFYFYPKTLHAPQTIDRDTGHRLRE